MKRRRAAAALAAVILLIAALALAGCNTGDFGRVFFHPAGLGGNGTPAFAIVGDARGKELLTYEIVPESGYVLIPTESLPLLDPIHGIPIAGSPIANLLEPDLRTLVDNGYVIVQHDNGALGIQSIDITINYDGMADFPQYPINLPETPLPKTGPVSLTAMGTMVDNTGTGEYLYVVDGGQVSGYTIDPHTASLNPIPGLPSGFGTMTTPVALVITATDQLVIAEPNQLHVLTIDTNTGSLSENVPPLPISIPADGGIAITPDAHFIYTVSTATDQIQGYSLDTGGVLTPLPISPITTDSGPVQILIDPTGSMLYSLNAEGHTVTGYAITPDSGALTPVAQPFPTLGKIGGGAIDPSARFLYLTDCDHGTIEELGINRDGTLVGPETTTPRHGNACGPVIVMQKYCHDLHRAC